MEVNIGDLKYLIDSFAMDFGLKEVILLGREKGVRRIILEDD